MRNTECFECGDTEDTIEIGHKNENTSIRLCPDHIVMLALSHLKQTLGKTHTFRYKKHTVNCEDYFNLKHVKNLNKDELNKYAPKVKKALNHLISEYAKYDIENPQKTNIKDIIFNQDFAIDEMEKLQLMAKYGIKRNNKPFYSVLFTGPTGVGKTQLALEIAKKYNYEFIKLNMAEYYEEHMKSRILGSPAGYIGHGGNTAFSNLKSDVPTLILLDEFEKAHASIQEIFLSILDKGEIVSSDHKKIDFRNTMLIFTSNLGVKYQVDNKLGLNKIKESTNHKVDFNEIRAKLLPEFIGRLSKIIEFNPINKEVCLKIVEKNLVFWANKLKKNKNIEILVNDWVKNDLVEQGFNPLNGARNIENTVEQVLLFKVVQELDKNNILSDCKVVVEDDYKMTLSDLKNETKLESNMEEASSKQTISEPNKFKIKPNWLEVYNQAHNQKDAMKGSN